MLKDIALNTIKKNNLIEENDFIIVGVSGGADSIALLHFLKSIDKKLNLKLIAVHINHGIRGKEALDDLKFVSNFCSNINVMLKTFSFNVKDNAKILNMSEEEAGRNFRYETFDKVLNINKANKIAVAHNKNDNVETFFLNLFRGSGLKGLSGIPIKRDNIIRPFLECSRFDIESYCKKNNLKYVTDSTNNLDIYSRNKIRLSLIPYLEENFNCNITSIISKTANIIKEEENFLNNLAKESLNSVLIDKSDTFLIIDINRLKKYDFVLIKRIFRLICLNFNKTLNNISEKHIDMILSLLRKQSGKSVNLPNNLCFKREHNTILVTNKKDINLKYEYIIPLDQEIYIKEINMFVYFSKKEINTEKFFKKVYTIKLDYDIIRDTLILRNRVNGDRIFLSSINGHKKLKDLFIDLKIPLHKRNSIPILANKDEIIAILGIKISDIFKPNKKTNKLAYVHFWEG